MSSHDEPPGMRWHNNATGHPSLSFWIESHAVRFTSLAAAMLEPCRLMQRSTYRCSRIETSLAKHKTPETIKWTGADVAAGNKRAGPSRIFVSRLSSSEVALPSMMIAARSRFVLGGACLGPSKLGRRLFGRISPSPSLLCQVRSTRVFDA